MKMKNILNSLFPWLAMTTLLSLQGCENEEGTAIHSRDTVSFEIDAGGARATETTFETGDAIGVYAATNVTDLVLKLKKTAHDTLLVYFRDMTLKPHTRYTVRIGFKQGIKGGDVNFEVTNFIVAPDKGLKYTISL